MLIDLKLGSKKAIDNLFEANNYNRIIVNVENTSPNKRGHSKSNSEQPKTFTDREISKITDEVLAGYGVNLLDKAQPRETNKAKFKQFCQDIIQKLDVKFDLPLFDKIFSVFQQPLGIGVIEKKHIY
jgi:hypothetical protein|tara:strand:- start:243 stop:623 length:381 start_codon:yes stop_codon:yes gene_type:complete